MCTRKKKEREVNKSSICPNKSMLLFCQASTVGWGKGAPSQSSLLLGWFWTLWQLSLDPGYHWLPFFSRAWYLSTTDTLRPSLVYSSVLSFQSAGGWSPLCCRSPAWSIAGVSSGKVCWLTLESLVHQVGTGGDRWGTSYSLLHYPSLCLTTHVLSGRALWERRQVGVDSLWDPPPLEFLSIHQPTGLLNSIKHWAGFYLPQSVVYLLIRSAPGLKTTLGVSSLKNVLWLSRI